MSTEKPIEKDQYLFQEGDPATSMYVVKKGKIGIMKRKGNSEVLLAEIGPGQMIGEMTFFDQKPRSAAAKALASSTIVVELPFAALQAHFNGLPVWLKAMIKTINENLRDANKKLKTLEKAEGEDDTAFPPHRITRMSSVLGFVTQSFGEEVEGGIQVPTGLLRNFTIQVFQLPTQKMQKFMQVLAGFGILTLEDLGEGRQRLLVHKKEFLLEFAQYYNDWLFKDAAKKENVEQKDMQVLKAIVHYAGKAEDNGKGQRKISLEAIQNASTQDLGHLISVKDFESVIQKGLTSEKIMEDSGINLEVDYENLSKIVPYWDLIFVLQNTR